jgi:hypothetical protein
MKADAAIKRKLNPKIEVKKGERGGLLSLPTMGKMPFENGALGASPRRMQISSWREFIADRAVNFMDPIRVPMNLNSKNRLTCPFLGGNLPTDDEKPNSFLISGAWANFSGKN